MNQEPIIIEYQGSAKYFWESWFGVHILQPIILPLVVLFIIAWCIAMCYMGIVFLEDYTKEEDKKID